MHREGAPFMRTRFRAFFAGRGRAYLADVTVYLLARVRERDALVLRDDRVRGVDAAAGIGGADSRQSSVPARDVLRSVPDAIERRARGKRGRRGVAARSPGDGTAPFGANEERRERPRSDI